MVFDATDEFERNLREGLSAEVGGWIPTPGEVRRAAVAPAGRRRLQVSLALAAVLILVAGGVGIAVGVSGGQKSGPSTLAAAPSPDDTVSASSSTVEKIQAECLAELQAVEAQRRAELARLAAGGSTETPAPPEPTEICGTTVPSSGVSTSCVGSSNPDSAKCADGCAPVSADCTDSFVTPPAVGATGPTYLPTTLGPVSPTPSAAVPTKATSPKPSDSQLPAQCSSADLHLSLTTDQSTYVQTDPVAITVSSTSTAKCQADEPEVSIQPVYAGGGLGDGHFTWVTCHGRAPSGDACFSSLMVYDRKPGETKGASYSWDMVTAPASGPTPERFASAGLGTGGQQYLITYSWGAVKATRTITVVQPPACTAAQLTVGLTADQSSYAQGQVAHFSGTIRNTSQQLCGAAPYVQPPTITDSSGDVIWSCADPSGLPENSPCATPAIAFAPEPLLPGATLAVRPTGGTDLSTAPLIWSWDLVHDGTKDAGPGPVPDGDYNLGWAGVGIGAAATVPIAITG